MHDGCLFNAPILEIEKAFVNDVPVEFEHNDAVSDLTLGANTSISHHQVYKSRYMNALRDADEGELIVKLPADCINQVRCRSSHRMSIAWYSHQV